MEYLYLMDFYKRQNKVWQLQIAGKDTTALQTPPNVKCSSLVYYGEPGEYSAAFTYNGSGGRVKMELKKNGAKELNRYYLSDCYEIDDRAVGGIKEKLYLGGDFPCSP